jgi:hypothetical protein
MSSIKPRKWLVTAAFIACLVVLLFYPFETMVVPEWKIRIVDAMSKPVPNIVVSEQWRNHSVEFHGHNEERTTDSEGYVSFPRRTVRASLMFRVVGSTLATLNVHGESGPKASTLVLGSYLTSSDSDYSPDKPSPEVIVVRPQR